MGAVESTIVPRVPSNRSMSTTTSANDSPVFRACAAGQSSGLELLAGLRPVRLVGLELVDRVHRRLAHPDVAQDVVAHEDFAVGGHDPESDRGGLDDGPEPRGLPDVRACWARFCSRMSRKVATTPSTSPSSVLIRREWTSAQISRPSLCRYSTSPLNDPSSQQRLQRVVPGRARDAGSQQVLAGPSDRFLAGPAEELLRRLVPVGDPVRRVEARRWRRGRCPAGAPAGRARPPAACARRCR